MIVKALNPTVLNLEKYYLHRKNIFPSMIFADCGLHLELHGCKQGEEFIGTTYVKQTGLNEVAMLNNFIVMYPQTKKNSMRGNPNGCFDWLVLVLRL